MRLGVVGFVLRSLRSSLAAGPLDHLLTLVTVCVALALVGGVLLVQRNLLTWSEHWANERRVAIFCDTETTAEERRTVAEAIRAAGVEPLGWRAPRETAGELAELLGLRGDTGELASYAPWVLEGRRTTTAPVDVAAVVADLEPVLHVDTGRATAERLRRLARWVRIGGGALVLLLLLAAFLVVANTVGLALAARRDEIEIMELVGTPLEWLYAAFVAEGVLIGALGALLAALVLSLPMWLGLGAWVAELGWPPLTGLGRGELALLGAWGAAIGAVGSWAAVRRVLRAQRL